MFKLFIKTSAIEEAVYSYIKVDYVGQVFTSIIVSLFILNGEDDGILYGRWCDYIHFEGLTEIQQEEIIKCVRDSLDILLKKK